MQRSRVRIGMHLHPQHHAMRAVPRRVNKNDIAETVSVRDVRIVRRKRNREPVCARERLRRAQADALVIDLALLDRHAALLEHGDHPDAHHALEDWAGDRGRDRDVVAHQTHAHAPLLGAPGAVVERRRSAAAILTRLRREATPPAARRHLHRHRQNLLPRSRTVDDPATVAWSRHGGSAGRDHLAIVPD
jgi:hypothetical protein